MPGELRSNSRGCLHKLVVQNFKSYSGNMTLGPFKDFTCVIGPNGSGTVIVCSPLDFVSRLLYPKARDFPRFF